MAELIASRSVRLTAQNPRLQSPTVPLGQLTSAITVKLRRPTTAQPLNWSANSTIRVSLVFLVDGIEYRCTGQASGGIRTDRNGQELAEYTLRYKPTVLLGQKAIDYMKTAVKDPEGYYNDVPLTRVGEFGSTVQGYLLLERLRGTINTTVIVAATEEAPAPTIRTKNSIAFDAASEAYEGATDGNLSVSHTSSGSNRAVFIGMGESDSGTSSSNAFSVTYGGAAMTGELWDTAVASMGNFYATAAAYKVGQSTGAQTVSMTYTAGGSSFPAEISLGVISLTGVDQTTPVGTPATASGASGTASVTVGSVNSTDMLTDHVIVDGQNPTAGTNQTGRYLLNATDGATFLFSGGSTQSGADGGVMSWSHTSAAWHVGAVAFKEAATGGRPPLSHWRNQATVRASHY